MLNDGVGAAVASANELQSAGGLIRASRSEIIKTLQKQLADGALSALEHQDRGIASAAHQAKAESQYGLATGAIRDAVDVWGNARKAWALTANESGLKALG
jgi:hypothetical protein